MLVESTGAGEALYDWTVAAGASVNYTLTLVASTAYVMGPVS